MPVNYQNGKIYKIVNDVNKTVYIGSTTRMLCQRMGTHRWDAGRCTSPLYTAMNQIGIKRFSIVLIKSYPCKDNDELEAEEYRVIDEFQADGVSLYNSIIGGKYSMESRTKMSKSNTKRGCVSYDARQKRWSFRWNVSIGNTKTMYFTVKRFGENGAHGLALAAQDEEYPRGC
jgi:group I intron endonuclease